MLADNEPLLCFKQVVPVVALAVIDDWRNESDSSAIELCSVVFEQSG